MANKLGAQNQRIRTCSRRLINTSSSKMVVREISSTSNMGRGAYDTTGNLIWETGYKKFWDTGWEKNLIRI
ncbi:hypothetical protein CGLO_17744 [Colletotrichum gloeosporioides Cg-14]|uniref:Uncharacterized protein n=1 Tax=Colletotrichum gloeosporioides (strain Cg-14) TaxID=1237896 RepID=T0KW87_COLGC|nr:hypothetical protein CGLO_17744 [Colletotrichum gloeosporioides Cg-14]